MTQTEPPFVGAAALLFSLVGAAQAQITVQDRAVTTYAQTYHQGTDLADTSQDSDGTDQPGPFQADLASVAIAFFNSARAAAGQTSDVDPATGSFDATGHATAELYVQGTGDAVGESRFELIFATDGAARLVLDSLVLTVDDTFAGGFSFDYPGEASARLEVRDETTLEVVYAQEVVLDDVGTYAEVDRNDPLELALGAGTWRLFVQALAEHEEPSITEVQGSLSAATFEFAGRFVRALEADVASISVGAGGAQQLTLDAGGTFAGDLYLVMGSLSGTSPGFPVGAHVLPLNPDPYFRFTLLHPNTPPLLSSFGLLDAGGRAAASFSLAAGSDPALVGLTLDHAYAVVDAAGLVVELASNSVPLHLDV